MKQTAIFSLFLSFVFFVTISHAESLTYEVILADAFEHAHELRQARVDYCIKEEIVDETRYKLWPELKLKFTSEYVEDLAGVYGSTIIGGELYSDDTEYQNSAYLYFTYTLIDYGEARNTLKIAKMDAQAAQFKVQKSQIDIEETILDLYSDLLSQSKQKDCLYRSLILVQQLIDLAEKTKNAGISDRLETLSREIEYEEIKGKLSKTNHEIKNILLDLTYYTGESYQDEKLIVSNLSFKFNGLESMDFKRHPDYQYYLLQHKKKDTEYKMVKRQFFPKVNLYAKYSYYGSDEEEYYKAFDGLREKNYSVGVYVSIPFIQNLKRLDELARIDLERSLNKTQMEKAYDTIKNEYEKLSRQYAFYLEDIEQKKRLLQLTRKKMTMLERLADTQSVELESTLEERLSLIDRELELEKQIIERQSTIKHILIRVEGTV